MKIGTKVRMVNCAEAELNQVKVFLTRSEPWDLCGTQVVLLEGKSGGFDIKCLEVVKENIGDFRECIVSCKGHDKKAFFHQWVETSYIISPSMMIGGHGGGQVRDTFALVEFEDGQVEKVEPNKIRFTS